LLSICGTRFSIAAVETDDRHDRRPARNAGPFGEVAANVAAPAEFKVICIIHVH